MAKGALRLGAEVGKSLLLSLGADCLAGAALASRLEDGVRFLGNGDVIGGFSPASMNRAAADFTSRGWLEPIGGGWQRTERDLPWGLSAFLGGAAMMRGIVIDDMEAVAVVTLPGAPSQIARALPIEGPIHASIERTNDEIARIARSAVNSITIMSPFVNREGAEFAMRTFDQSGARQKVLITRLAGSTGRAVRPLLNDMSARGIRVLNYLVPAGDGYETFHAKVVIADSDLAYVGSANLTMYDRHSMELGIIVKGKAARAVSALVRSVERIAIPVGHF